MYKPQYEMRNWWIEEDYTYEDEDGVYTYDRLRGNIYNRHRFDTGEPVMIGEDTYTSCIMWVHSDDLLETKNTFYQLGEPRKISV